jgi:hypothetical protein
MYFQLVYVYYSKKTSSVVVKRITAKVYLDSQVLGFSKFCISRWHESLSECRKYIYYKWLLKTYFILLLQLFWFSHVCVPCVLNVILVSLKSTGISVLPTFYWGKRNYLMVLHFICNSEFRARDYVLNRRLECLLLFCGPRADPMRIKKGSPAINLSLGLRGVQRSRANSDLNEHQTKYARVARGWYGFD